MQATELTCDSDIELVRALRSVGVLSGLREDDPGDTPGPQQTAPASRRDTPDVRHAALRPRRDAPAARSGRPRDTPVAPLRLTRRGRVVVALAAALLVTMVSLLLAGVAPAAHHGPSPRAARENLVQVIVRPGQSLWSVAESADPDQDTRAVIQQ